MQGTGNEEDPVSGGKYGSVEGRHHQGGECRDQEGDRERAGSRKPVSGSRNEACACRYSGKIGACTSSKFKVTEPTFYLFLISFLQIIQSAPVVAPSCVRVSVTKHQWPPIRYARKVRRSATTNGKSTAAASISIAAQNIPLQRVRSTCGFFAARSCVSCFEFMP